MNLKTRISMGAGIFLLMILLMNNVLAQSTSSTVMRSFSNSIPNQCSSLAVKLTVSVNSTDTFYTIDETVPTGWNITSLGGGDNTIPNNITWVILTGAQNTTLNYTVAVPCNALGNYTFTGDYGFDNGILHTTLGQSIVTVIASTTITTTTTSTILTTTTTQATTPSSSTTTTVPVTTTTTTIPVSTSTTIPSTSSTTSTIPTTTSTTLPTTTTTTSSTTSTTLSGLANVHGRVTYKDYPVANATVEVKCMSTTFGYSVECFGSVKNGTKGITDSNGNYSIDISCAFGSRIQVDVTSGKTIVCKNPETCITFNGGIGSASGKLSSVGQAEINVMLIASCQHTTTTTTTSSTTTEPVTTTSTTTMETTTTEEGTSTTTTTIEGTTSTLGPTTTTTISSSSTTSTTIADQTCAINGDLPPCGEVNLKEVIRGINLWFHKEFSLRDVIVLMRHWDSNR